MRQALRAAMEVVPGRGEIHALRNYWYDFQRFRAHSSAATPESSPQAFAARVTKAFHRLEKGLALPEPRPGFGRGTVAFLLGAVPRLEAANASPDLHAVARGARGALAAYLAWHDAAGQGEAVPPGLRPFLDGPPKSLPGGFSAGLSGDLGGLPEGLPGGTRRVTREELRAATAIDFPRFARARWSVRQFTGAPVAEADVRDAVATALKSPRVCNRESRRVHAGFSPETRERMLAFQNGNRGFGHLAGAVLVVTSDLRAFTDWGERNQAWVDGGLFAMNLVHALHAKGLGTCLLNWSAPFWRDRPMRRALGIPDHEAVVTFLAVGQLPESFLVAASPGPGVDEVLRRLG